MTLVKFLPLAIGESIPEGDEHWSWLLMNCYNTIIFTNVRLI